METRKLTRAEIRRALRDADFRATLTKEQRAQLVETALCVAEGADGGAGVGRPGLKSRLGACGHEVV